MSTELRRRALALALFALAPPAAAYTPQELAAAVAEARDVRAVVERLAAPDLGGRGAGLPGGLAARELLVDWLAASVDGLDATRSGRDAYLQPFSDHYANVLGILPGREPTDEVVLVGAHYDHLADCRSLPDDDQICNGAADNAAGVAVVLGIARALAALPEPPRRSVAFALWDAEEIGLLGSRHFVEHPLVPLADVVAYVNFDIQGANLAPSARNRSFAVGAESGGPLLVEVTEDAIAATGTLATRRLSTIFGQGRSDYHPFWEASVPIVFFTDATNACYHTTRDDLELLDTDKLARQAEIGLRTVLGLAEANDRPVFTPPAELATFDDLLVIGELLGAALADRAHLDPDFVGALETAEAEARAHIAAGPEAFNPFTPLDLALTALDVAQFGLPCDPVLLPAPAPGAAGAAGAAALAALAARRRRGGRG